MFRRASQELQPQSAQVEASPRIPVADDRIIITRDVASGEWQLEMSDGLDLLEVARVVGVIQNHAIEMMQEQATADTRPQPASPPKINQSITDTVEF